MEETSSKVKYDLQIRKEAQVFLDVLNNRSSKEKDRLTYDKYNS